MKGYCVILILFLPGTFAMGGYLATCIIFTISATITTICVQMLVNVGIQYNTYSYSLVIE